MKILVFLVAFSILFYIGTQNPAFAQDDKHPAKSSVSTKTMKISSVFENNGKIPKKYTCSGTNVSPPLKISNVPKNAKSLALILDDPDAPGGTFTHWVVWGMSPKKTQIGEGEKKGFIEGVSGIGKPGYFGPCPPSGVHRYVFKIYALDFPVDISTKSTKQELLSTIQNHIIQTAVLTGKYSR
ncbi:YbhB/YbcL family Raf kinase inhibitor-like protein [Candidatus Nitrosotenuis chungbukensis]|uniref:YbhB/YbcL family Raf kinase inhibitor-like protein n=1 Tax=Candidatus Nitrosotenuis chungbukensis TaxID=1353246 RepID=UPI000694C84F|nr:YbhB/YbcL family Raf kinase inhibitor-like protein [Candidatus Nitrosotenuis chungbukensis]WKT57084.1 YbhB/YbcL family Raf kinase inhibitor-like protein [Candidatus Nitrosotenuis chungbukensis]